MNNSDYIISLLNSLSDVGIQIYLANGKLKTKAVKGAITPKLANEIKQKVADVQAEL